jgi:hypothetical protein
MSLDVWPAITGWLESSARAISEIECSYSDNQIFVMPERLILRFMP